DEDGTRKKMIAVPVTYNEKVVGAVHIVASMTEVYNTMDRVNQIFFSGTIIALCLTGVLGVVLAHTITHPIQGLTRQAELVAEGHFDMKAPVLGNDEIGRLSMADRKSTRLNSSHVKISYAVFCLKKKKYSNPDQSLASI